MKLDLAFPVGVSFASDTLKQIHRNLGIDVAVQGAYLRLPEHNLRIDVKIQDAGAGGTIAAVSEIGMDAQIAEPVKQAGQACVGNWESPIYPSTQSIKIARCSQAIRRRRASTQKALQNYAYSMQRRLVSPLCVPTASTPITP